MSIVERIVTVYNDKGSKQAVKDLKKLEKNFIDSGKKIGKAFGVATLAVGAFATKIGVDAVKGAMEDQKQQAALATALRNTTGATDEAIAATTQYLDKLELLVGVDNNQLIPSLQILTQATQDVTQAQALQSLALDISAGTSKDLTSVSLALAKALGGNVGALTRLGVPLDANAVKAKDLNAILTSLGETFAGQAEKRAETFEFRMMKLQLAFNQIIDQIGYALIPVLEEFAQYVVQNVLPAIQEWVDSNKDELAKGLKDVGTTLITVGKSLAGFFKTISDNLVFIKAFAAIFIGAKLATGIYAIVTAIGVLRAAFVGQAAAATAAGTATAFATGGASAIAAAAAIGTFVAASGAAFIAINRLTAASDAGAASTETYNSHLKDLGKIAEQVAAANLKNRKIIVDTVTTTKQLTAAEKKAAEVRAAIKKAGLDKFGIKNVSETDPIQLEAARLNLLKQNNLQEQRRLEAVLENMKAQMKANEAVQRYVDLLGVVADKNISNEEVVLLSLKWGISQDAVVAYTTAIFAVNDAKLSTEEIDLLAKQWGITKQQAEMYLDFFKAINDGKLDQTEINALMDKWKLTSKEVNDYAKKIADGVVPSDLWPTPGNQAAQSWRDALAALNAYLAAAGAKLAPTPPTTPTPTPGGGGGGGGNRGGGGPGSVTPASIQIETLTGLRKATEVGTGVNFLLKEQIDELKSATSTLSIANQSDERTRLTAMGLFDKATDPVAQASLKSGLAGGASLSGTISGSRYAAQAAAQYGTGATINVTVQGNVTTEKDLVTSIRDGLLQGQNSGQAILKDATAI